MIVLTCKISINNLVFDFVNKTEAETAWQVLTDRATIVIPRNVKIDKDRITEYIKTGDSVKIELGYDDKLEVVFSGYVTHIKPRVPIEITCEDSMWKLKQLNISYNVRKESLKDVLTRFFKGYKLDVEDTSISRMYIDKLSGSRLLEKLKNEYSLYGFFRGETLVVGKQYNPETANEVKFRLHYNIIDDDLIYKTKDQVKLKVKAISNNADGSKSEVEIGDLEGETRTLKFYNQSMTELKKAAHREYNRLMYDGWRGSFTAFGEPFVKHGDIVEIQYERETEKTGRYWVDKVKYSFGTNGYRQTINLGAKV